MAEKREILCVKSRTFQTVQRDFHIVVYPEVMKPTSGFFSSQRSLRATRFISVLLVVTLCIVNKNDLFRLYELLCLRCLFDGLTFLRYYDAVISVNGSICASLKCEKVQKDFVYKVGVWNREEIVFAISTFYNPTICLKKLADVSSEDRSMTFILHIPDHLDPGEIQDLDVPALDMIRKEILTGGHRIIDRDSRIEHIQVEKQTEQDDVVTERASLSIAFLFETLLAETQSNAEVAKEKFDKKLKSFAGIIENLNGDRQSLAEEIRQFKREVLQLGKKAEKDERELEISPKLLDESQVLKQLY
ncbi:hypothetical protein RHGRI_003162 [Rhododendron griersonianum]|uniref:Uncharacterized protein n=1 Tax=Rhododendron griersonianum TaxID=479676 RepID=A0AAV6L456_9ERIC|nr:hypothetical protein RHGRI_003162 [Rhododendron griersonianum]